jgi:hypothetical protein
MLRTGVSALLKVPDPLLNLHLLGKEPLLFRLILLRLNPSPFDIKV